MRKVDDGEEKKKKKEKRKKRMLFLVATNVVASRPPERRPTGTLHARANFQIIGRSVIKLVSEQLSR